MFYFVLNRQEFEMENNNAYEQIKKDTDPSAVSEADRSADNETCGTTEAFYETIPGNY